VIFPEGFLWGTATSAHQVEGGNVHNDWWEFEKRFTPSGAACDFLNRFEEDLDRARALGTNAFRFSVEWSRIEPRPGERDPEAVRYYERLVEACRERGLRPILTLVQFTLPRWCAEKGGWLAPETLEAFERHVRFVAQRFPVDLYVTINEPNVQAGAGYMAGVFAPGKRFRPDLTARCEAALVRAHTVAHRVLHEVLDEVEVGVSPHVIAWRRSGWDLAGLVAKQGEHFNWSFLDALPPETLDFVGMNYFMSMPAHALGALRFAGLLRRPAREGTSDMGWPIDAPGFEEALVTAHRRYGKPIIVTENGIADATDMLRPRYLVDHVSALEGALRAGARVRGYCHWSLIDNFEWHEGFAPRFGLYAVDYATQERKLRASGELYRLMIRERSGQVVRT
jgi:beta-glucosidase